MSGAHSLISPSSADIWVNCAGSPLMSLSADLVDENTQDALEGEASHWIVSESLDDWRQGVVPDPMGMVGRKTPDGVILTEEMARAAMVMVDDVIAIAGDPTATEVHVEEYLHIPSVHDESAGTPDTWLFNGEVFQWDYKYGHKDVPADSWQNVNYTAGILDRLNVDGLADQNTYVNMIIVQPRGFSPDGPIKRYRCLASDLRARVNQLGFQAAMVFSENPEIVSGDHCQYCPAKYTCKSARQSAYAVVDYVNSAMPETMSATAVSFELTLLRRAKKALEHRLTGIEQLATSMIGAGLVVPGYVVDSAYGNRKFSAEKDELVMLGDMLGVSMLSDPSPISPAEFDRRIIQLNKERKAAGLEPIDTSVINSYIYKPNTGQKLMTSDESPALTAFKPKED